MKTYQKTALNRNNEQFITVTENSYDADGIGTRRTAFVPVEPDKADVILGKLRGEEWHVEFGSRNRQNPGVYDGQILKMPEPAAEGVEAGELASETAK